MINFKPLVVVALSAVIIAEPAMAQNLDPITNMLQTIATALSGPIGRLLAIIAWIAAAFSFFTGRINWVWLVAITVACVIAFNADTIVDGFAT